MVASCSPWSASEQRAIDSSNAYLDAIGLADFGKGRKVAVREEGTQWAVVYRVSEGAAGGDFVVLVDKQTLKAVNHVGYQ